MTESERIIKEGILPASFFQEEVRDEYLVKAEMKKVWAIEIDLFLKFSEVCNLHGLRFWGDGGTLLGAVRHNGFIPWDDDMDLIMPREDYNILMKIGPKAFCEPYFLQTPHTDPNYGYSFAKLRNSNTTCMPRIFQKSGFNHGIHIDIFPLDYLNLDNFEDDKAAITEHIMRNSSFMKRNSIELLNERQLQNFKKYQTDNPAKEYDAIQAICSNPQYIGSEHVANCTVTSLKSSAQIWKAKWFAETIMHKFENIEIPMPVEIDLRLKAQYGDYMQFPPVEQRGCWHPDVIWDADKSYKEYI